ncbi:Ni/Co efflux regulator RcnB [Janthinobacterium sp. CG_23.3]|uniref:DUF3016 domain-containing protein n=1 Tax=Janthinobacterium sp. CG_23.3 TaxID=3349634 RepID=UPI0038D3CA71
MRVFSRTMLAACALALSGGAWAAVSVSYTQPEKFSDLPFSIAERERILKELSAHFLILGKRLPAGQNLNVEVRDIDLAGREERTGRTADEIRVLRGGADWPRISLRYTLESNGQVLDSGEAKLSDMAYMDKLNRYASGDRLRYEKRMIDDWFAKQFKAAPRG